MTRPYLRRIDQPAPVTGGGNELLSAQGEQLGAPVVTVAHPTDLTIEGTGVLFSGVTPTSYANLRWTPGNGTPPRATYQVQQATNAGFTTGVRTDPTDRTDASVNGVPGQAYWYRVRTLLDKTPSAWSNVVTTTLPVDTAPPDPPTATAASFAVDGTLEVRATPPASANFKHIRVEIYNAANTALLDSSQFAGGVWAWSPTRNRERTAAAGLGAVSTQVTVRLAAISHGNVASTTVTIAVASPAPATPAGLSHSWAGDTGTAGADLLITHTVVAGLSYHLSIDGQERQITPGRYPYPFGQNAAEHGGAADPVLTLSLVAENGLGQRSATPATATATNAPPATVAITLSGGGNETLGILLGQSNAPDLRDYRVRLYRDATLIDTLWLVDIIRVVQVSQRGEYTADVTVYDVFGQPSAVTTAAAVALDPLTLAMLREALTYRDSLGTAPATLKAVLADGVS